MAEFLLSVMNTIKSLTWLLTIFSFIGTCIVIFLTSYLKQKGKDFATKENLKELSKKLQDTTRIAEETKLFVQRSENAKSKGTHKIMNQMAEIESTILRWKMVAYFSTECLRENETIEELGRKDIQKASALLVDLTTTLSSYRIYLSKEILNLMHKYSSICYEALYAYEAAYRTSINKYINTDTLNTSRLKTVTECLEYSANEKMSQLADVKDNLCKKLIEELKLS
jgi:ABC-type multidrug transport system fused ATPase/permease subunit